MIIFYVESVPFFIFWQSLFVSPEVAVAVVVGVDDDGLHHNLGVNHDELQLLRLRKVLGRVFTKLVMQSLTGIDGCHGPVVATLGRPR